MSSNSVSHARPNHAPMPWLLIALVLATTGMAVLARTDTQRLMVLAIAETTVVGYFCVALVFAARASRARKAQSIVAR